MKNIDTYILEKANFLVKKHVKNTSLKLLERELTEAKQDTLLLKINGDYSLDDSYIGKDKYDGNKDDVVGICLGDGIWALTHWVGLSKKMSWASQKNTPYKTRINNIESDGLTATNKVLKVKDVDKEELWWELLNIRKEYENAYIPSKDELKSVYDNKTELEEDLLNLLSSCYWSSTQSDYQYNYAVGVLFNCSGMYDDRGKHANCPSIVFTQFANT